MILAHSATYSFGPFVLDATRLTLTLAGEPQPIGPRVVETLLALVERAGEVVTKAELLERVWPDADVEEANLAQNVYVLRRLFRGSWSERAIQTIPRRGYRFVAPVRVLGAETTANDSSAVVRPRPWRLSRRFFAAIVLCVATLALATAAHEEVRRGPAPLSARGAEAYQLGHYYWNLRTEDGFLKSIRYFTQVTRSDPRSPLGFAGLADAYGVMDGYDVGILPPGAAAARARAFAGAALERDPRSSEAHALLGYLQFEHGKSSGAGRQELERAVALDPHNAAAHLWLGASLHSSGLTSQARSELEIAERLDPASPATESWLASSLFLSREYDAALERLHRALDLDPGREDALKQLGTVEAQRGALQPALDAFARLGRACPRCRGYLEVLRAYAYAKTHRPLEARAAIAAVLKKSTADMDAEVAFVYVALGDRESALAWLRRTQREPPKERALLALDPRLDPVRDDARFNVWTRTSVST